VTDEFYQTPPDFFDPDDDGINEYFNSEGQRITKAEWVMNQPAFDDEPESLPLASDAYHRVVEAEQDFGTLIVGMAEVRARLDNRDEVTLADVNHVVAEVFRQIRDV
jgi:hypothetical protein